MQNNCAVILAAGQGKRMKSNHAKVMCEVLFKPMLGWVLDAVSDSGITDICTVVGHCGNEVKEYLNGIFPVVEQHERLGTGHAVMPVSYTHLDVYKRQEVVCYFVISVIIAFFIDL